jgi:hypothetical protein
MALVSQQKLLLLLLLVLKTLNHRRIRPSHVSRLVLACYLLPLSLPHVAIVTLTNAAIAAMVA